MRALVVTPWFPSEANPVESIFHLRDVELLALDNEITVIHLDGSISCISETSVRSSNGQSFRLIRLPFSLWKIPQVIRARRFLRRLLPSFEILHTMSGPALLPFFGVRVSNHWIHTEHWSAFARPSQTWREKVSLDVIKFLYERPRVIVAVSHFLANAIRPHRKGRLEVIGNFVSTRTESSYEQRSNYQLQMIGIGSVIESKGPQIAIETVASLLDRGIDAGLVWFGDGPLREYCQSLVLELGINDRVQFPGNVSNEIVQRALSQADLFIAPTELETFGVAVAEAMSNGLPVVISGRGGFLEFLHSPSSRVLTARTAGAFAEAVIELLGSNSLPSREEIATFARVQFDESKRRGRYRQLYSS